MRAFAFSDIHGCSMTFDQLLSSLSLSKKDQLYFLGDYIDRGPDSKGVLDTIMALQDNHFQVRCLRGNHEQLMLDALHNPDSLHTWLTNGGRETLNSFGVHDLREVPQKYFDFLNSLEWYISLENYILVHAGLNFHISNPLEDQISMMWIRNWYKDIRADWLGNRIIVHGHTPISRQNMIALRESGIQAVNIDNGCVFHHKSDMGRLCTMELISRQLYFEMYCG